MKKRLEDIMKLKRLFAVATSVMMAGTMLVTLAACKKPVVPPEEPEGEGAGLVFTPNYVGESNYQDGSLDYGEGQFSNPDSWGEDDGASAFVVPLAADDDDFFNDDDDDDFFDDDDDDEDDSDKVIESYFVSSVGTNTDIHLTIPSTYNGYPVVAIGVEAFANHDKLRTLKIPSSIKRIARSAFSHCTALLTVNFEEGCEYLGDFCFSNCTDLKTVNLPYSLRVIDDGAFMACTFLQKIKIPDGVQKIEANCFSNCSDLVEVNIPSSVKQLSYECFYGCSSLREFYLHGDITSIPDRYFMVCTNLKDIYFDGTQEEWDAMPKGDKWDYQKGGTRKRSYDVHFADGTKKSY